ncbi:hypothetical protein U0Y97_03430 [Enterobacter chuandaensis]|uniref:hypothetical protein n=1 Tax=Enterobacter chuandaensis TaxID=2497875 RepID=UPI0039C0B6E6
MHDEIIKQAREILPQRLNHTVTMASQQDTASYLALQPDDREQAVKRNAAAVIYSPINDTRTTASAAHTI